MIDKQCPYPAFYRFTWPGNDEAYVCFYHATKLLLVASAIGMNVHPVALGRDDKHLCEQRVSVQESEE